MLALAVEKNEPEILKDLLASSPRRPGYLSIEDLLRVELSIQPHQRKCYKLIAWEIDEERREEAIDEDMLQRLGFEDVLSLYAARCGVNSFFWPRA